MRELVDRRAAAWTEDKRVGTLAAAFQYAVKLPAAQECGSGSSSISTVRLLLLDTLAGTLLPLVPIITVSRLAIRPLWAIAKSGYAEAQGRGSGGAAGELSHLRQLVAQLLERLSQQEGELLLHGHTTEQASLWWALSRLPAPQRGTPEAETLRGVMGASSKVLIGAPEDQLDAVACSGILVACAHLG